MGLDTVLPSCIRSMYWVCHMVNVSHSQLCVSSSPKSLFGSPRLVMSNRFFRLFFNLTIVSFLFVNSKRSLTQTVMISMESPLCCI